MVTRRRTSRISSGFAKPCIVFCVKNGPCWCAAVVGVLVLNASAVFSSYLALDAGFGVWGYGQGGPALCASM